VSATKHQGKRHDKRQGRRRGADTAGTQDADHRAGAARAPRRHQDRFDIYWMRHTGKCWRLHTAVTLAEALELLETDGTLHPV